MSELEELPSWAGRSVSGPKSEQSNPQPTNPEGPNSERTDPEHADPEHTEPEHAVPEHTAGDQAGLGPDQGQRSGASPVVNADHAASQTVDHTSTEVTQRTAVMQEQVTTPQHLPEERRRKPWLMFLFGFLGLLALVGMGVLGYLLAQSQDSSETATTSGAETDTQADAETTEDDDVAADSNTATEAEDATDQAPVTVDTEGDAADEDAAAGSTTDGSAADGDATAGNTSEDNATEDGAEDQTAADGADPSDSGRQAIFRGGKVYLSGPVPSEEVGQLIEAKAAAVVGPDNVVNEYVIDPTTVIPPGSSAPLYVEDVVLFGFNSVEIASPFLPILDLGTLLLRQNPQATITVVTRTDAVGSEAVNLDVSTKRAQAVINYWLSKGVNRDQIVADPRGEEGASEDDDEEAAALRRRAEFIITGLLD